MTLEELVRADADDDNRHRYPLSTPAMVLVGAALSFLLVPAVGFGDQTLQSPNAETVRIYAENGMEAPEPEMRWDEDAFNDKGRLMLGVGALSLGLGLLWVAYRAVRRWRTRVATPELVAWITEEPDAVARLESVSADYVDTRGRPVHSSRGVVATRHDGRTTAMYASDPATARAVLSRVWRGEGT